MSVATRGSSRSGSPIQKLEPERRRDLVREEASERFAGDASHELADDPAVGARVVAVLRARAPSRAPAPRSPATTGCHAKTSSSVNVPSTAASPARWQSAQRTGIVRPCPPRRTRASSARSARPGRGAPRSTRRSTQIAVTPLVVEKTSASVSRVHGPPGRAVGEAAPEVDDGPARDGTTRTRRRRRRGGRSSRRTPRAPPRSAGSTVPWTSTVTRALVAPRRQRAHSARVGKRHTAPVEPSAAGAYVAPRAV